MCGRYVFSPDDNFFDRFEIPGDRVELESNYNVAPGSTMPVVIQNGARSLEFMRWGLVPPWADDPNIGYRMINARSETVNEKASFKAPFRTQRCLVPSSGFYEWQQIEGGKQPFYIHSDEMLALAGLYEIVSDAQGRDLRTYTIITTQSTTQIEQVHSRMPLLLGKEEEQAWLDIKTPLEQLFSILKTPSKINLSLRPVSTAVNSPKNNRPELLNELEGYKY